eukprot:5729870-Pyramimonas_sp.AAC.1
MIGVAPRSGLGRSRAGAGARRSGWLKNCSGEMTTDVLVEPLFVVICISTQLAFRGERLDRSHRPSSVRWATSCKEPPHQVPSRRTALSEHNATVHTL